MRRALAAAGCLLAAATAAQAQIYRFRTYSTNTGLPSNAVYSIYQDREGYIWFATDGGASRYDGVAYTNYSLPQGLVDASVRAFVEDRDGRLWIATKGGLSRFDGSRFESLTTAQGLVHNEVRCALRAADGTLWFGTTRGLARWDGQRFTSFGVAQGLPPEPVWTLLQDRTGTLWAGLRGGGLARLDGARFTAFGRKDGLPDSRVFGLAEDPAGGLWVATSGGLAHFDGRRFRSYGKADGVGSERVSSVLVDRHGRVWCGTFGGGISRLENSRFTVFDHRNGAPDDYVTALFKDQEQNVWVGSLWSGAFRFVSEEFANFTVESGLGQGMTTGIAQGPDGALWFSSITSGLSRLGADGSVRRYGIQQGLASENVLTLLIDSRRRVWAGTLAGASYLEGGRFRNFPMSELGLEDRINTLIEDRQGRIWFGSGSAVSTGVVAWDGKTFTHYGVEDGLAHVQINTFALDHEGRLLVCTEDGLSRFDGKRFATYRRSDGLPAKRVLVALDDGHGVLWIGTPDGLVRFDGRTFKLYTTHDGLAGNLVHALAFSGSTLWVGTSRGISAFDGARFRSYTVKDGLIGQEISMGAALSSRDGSLWFGTPTGAVRYRAAEQTGVALPPRVRLSALRARDVDVPLAGDVSLPHGRNSLSFEFLGLSFADEEGVRYSYRLEGAEAEWSEPSPARSVRFTNLAPGRYRFEVKARSAAGLWSAPVAVALEIRPAFWGTWWFRLLALAGGAGVIYAGYGVRVRSLERRHRQRIAALRQLLESIRVINSGLDLPTLLQNIAEESARLVGGEPGGIGLVRENRVLFERVFAGDHWEARDLSMPLGEGIAGRVAATGVPLIANDLRAERATDVPDPAEGAAGVMAVPVVDRGGKVVGVLEVRRPPQRAQFGDAERQLLEALTHQAAVAIENAALYGALEEKKVQVTESLWAIEELYKNEQQLTRMLEELNRMKTNFMIVTSHEMRTPLTLLKGYHEALLQGFLGELTHAQEQCLSLGHRTVDRMIESFNDILEMLQIDERRAVLHAVPIDIKALAAKILEELGPFFERRKQRVSLEAAEPLPALSADPDKVRLILVNLVENAIKFTPDSGEIRLVLRGQPAAIHLAVEDTGIGIEAWELERVFDRFYAGPDSLHHSSGTYQFKARGTGLGLAIAKGHVEAHGGRIWAESRGAGQGSSFHVVLPLAPVVVGAGTPLEATGT